MIVGNLNDKVSSGKRKASRPERMQGRLSFDTSGALGLLTMPEMLYRPRALKVADAHDGAICGMARNNDRHNAIDHR